MPLGNRSCGLLTIPDEYAPEALAVEVQCLNRSWGGPGCGRAEIVAWQLDYNLARPHSAPTI